jgi:RimJ/RimL family protein N-acetyltransferase
LPDLIFGHDEAVARWVAARIPQAEAGFAGPIRAIGVGIDGMVVAGFVYSNWHTKAGSVELSVAAENPRWATLRIVSRLLEYPFLTCDCQRITLSTSERNSRAQRLAMGLGFVPEAVIVRAYGLTENAIVLRLFREDWLRSKFHIKESSHGKA